MRVNFYFILQIKENIFFLKDKPFNLNIKMNMVNNTIKNTVILF